MKIIEKIESLKESSLKYQLLSSYHTLQQVDDVIKYHDDHFTEDISLVIINIYGLLQSLFVGIDSLYSLVIGITKNKYNINVNQNKSLNELKHIRNDIVGHPTNRKYGQNGNAYSIIDNALLNYNEFKYNTYIFNNNQMNEKSVIVNLDILKAEYSKEKLIIVNRLKEFILNKPVMINLDTEVMYLFNEPSNKNLEIVKNKFINHYGNLSSHRFMWRLEFVESSLNWESNDKEIREFINYVTKYQVLKILEITQQMEKKNVRLPHLRLPNILKKVYKYLDRNPNLVEYTKNLHDNKNPFFESDLNYLIDMIKDNSINKLLMLLKSTKDDKIIYLIGSTIKNYKKK